MPHINVKCYPKHLSEQQMKDFIADLTNLTQKHLGASEDSISISYEEIPAEQWKNEVFDKEIKPNIGRLAKDPGYDM